MIRIDGSYGEGGGQILRTSLALSLVTGKAFTIENIRAGRRKPGLMRQHLTAVNAAAEIGQARIEGNTIGSRAFVFEPKTIQSGRLHYAIGSAGSCTLVLQTILPALIHADGPSEVLLEGGTHNPYAPPFDFLQQTFLPLLGKMGADVTAVLERPGFYPAGGGKFRVAIGPIDRLKRLDLCERGEILRQSATAVVSQIPISIAQRELKVLKKKLGWEGDDLRAVAVENSRGPGNIVSVAIESEHVAEVFTGFGERGVRAERVASRTVNEVRAYLGQEVPVGKYLADQLLVPMALAGGGKFHTLRPSRHTITNAEIIKLFLDMDIQVGEYAENRWEIAISPKP